jgi:hypothetical protein
MFICEEFGGEGWDMTRQGERAGGDAGFGIVDSRTPP